MSMKEISYRYNGKEYYFNQSKEAYLSPYSYFMLDSFKLMNLHYSNSVCDFGAGTGVLGIVATSFSPKQVVLIEKNTAIIPLLRHNCGINGLNVGNDIEIIADSNQCSTKFDHIICNPASLPNCVHVNSFCDGGVLGLDMILQVLCFASTHLTKTGKLFMIITSVLPVSIVKKKADALGFSYKIINEKNIPFRPHYAGIIEWVNSLKSTYNEMSYIDINGEYYETIALWEFKKE